METSPNNSYYAPVQCEGAPAPGGGDLFCAGLRVANGEVKCYMADCPVLGAVALQGETND